MTVEPGCPIPTGGTDDNNSFELIPKDKHILELNHKGLSLRQICQRLKIDHGIKLSKSAVSQPIRCHKCGAELRFRNDVVGHKGRKIPLEPFFNNEPHAQHCMYPDVYDSDTEPMLFDFLSKVPNHRPKRIIGAVGRAK